MPTTDHKPEWSTVIYNGPSRSHWQGLTWSMPLIGCNLAYRDFPVTAIVAIDRMTVAEIEREWRDRVKPWPCWTKDSSLPLPTGWDSRPSPGIDTGSMAIELALTLSYRVMVIGCDGVMGGSRETAYDYHWHRRVSTKNIHQRHRQSLIKVYGQNPGRILMVWPEQDPDLETMDLAVAKTLVGKYLITEATDG